jgi:polysaccharide biosynthesis protein PslG
VATALVAVALAVPAPADAKVPRGFVGMTADDVFVGDDNYRTTNLSAMASIGVTTIRQTFDWATIEQSPGFYDLSYHDEFVAKASAHGIRILPVLFNPPAFHRPTRGVSACPPHDLGTFASFAQAVVRRYGPRGTLWAERPELPKNAMTAYQIWNEPSLRVYWCNRKGNGRRYVAMLRRVGRAIKSVDRRAKIVTAGLPDSKLRTAVPLQRYLTQMYRAGARRHFDSLAINPYAKNRADLTRLLRSVRRLMNRRGDRRAPIWITELGWASGGPAHRFNVGHRGQARRIAEAFALIRKLRRPLRLNGVVYYRWRDVPRYPPKFKDQWGLHTGLIDINGGFKRAFDAFKNAVARLP